MKHSPMGSPCSAHFPTEMVSNVLGTVSWLQLKSASIQETEGEHLWIQLQCLVFNGMGSEPEGSNRLVQAQIFIQPSFARVAS